MYFERLNEQNVEQYIDYLKLAIQQEPDMMTVEEIDEEGIRTRLRDSFYEKSTSILAMENNQVVGRIEYHFYGCIQDGYLIRATNENADRFYKKFENVQLDEEPMLRKILKDN